MKDHIIIEGKDVEEAIEKGLKQLNVSREEVHIDILQEGKKGFLSIGAKEARVKLTNKSAKKEEPAPEEEKEPEETVAAVKNGKFIFKGPKDGEVEIHFSKQMRLYKNDEMVTEQTKVTATPEDKLHVEFDTIENDTEWNVTIDKSLTEAKLTVTPGNRKVFKLKNHSFSKNLKLQAEEQAEPNLTLTTEMVYTKLKDLGVTFGIENEAIENATKAKEKDEFVIAKGDPPEEGKNGWVEFKVDVEEGKKYVERDDGSVDFRETRSIPSVEEGAEVAVIHNPITGKPGQSIKGGELLPKPVHPINVKSGKGVEVKNEQLIMAISTGKPTVEKRAQTVLIDVVPVLDHAGDVDLKAGNIRFNGDIHIGGSVAEGMAVEAAGDIEIKGTTSKAKVSSGKSITLMQNVILSSITAGNSNKIVVEKGPILEEIGEDLKILLASFNQLLEQRAVSAEDVQQKGVLPFLKLLIDNKVGKLPANIRKFADDVKNDEGMLDEHWHDLANTLFECFIKMNPNSLRKVEELEELINEVNDFYEQTQTPPDDPAKVTLASAMNSEIYCSGDINVIKQGCYNTNLHAGGLLTVDGYVRGGEIYASKGVEIKEVGSQGGAISTIIVPKDSVIKMKHVMADTCIQIGKQKYKFNKEDFNVVAKIEDGRIILH